MDGSKGHKFRSDRWIGIKLLLEFPDALFHGVDEESILGDDEVWSSQAGWTVRKAITFHRSLDRDQTFTGVSGCTFPWSRYGIATRSGGGRVARDQLTDLERP
jgi:hypothetical protein